MAKQLPVLTGQELEIMKVVWGRDSVTVRDVYEALRARRSIAYTTVMTLMRILERKGHLKVSRADRAFVYRPARARQRVVGEMVREFVDRVFGGAAGPLVQHLVRDRHLTEDDLRDIATQLKSRKSEDTDER
ncbi:MAG: BlaI/MecI/CopY family transcriptional regulator [Acidobacteria bacterium]|nr:MAG: BlaI/MecI/CopY family transcriptional regulator [Acidobacteriota bacterium]